MGNPGQPQYPMTLQSPLHQPSVPQSTESDSVMKLQARIKELERDVQSPEDTPDPSSPQCQNKSHHSRRKDPVQVHPSPAQESYVSHRSPANLGSRRSPGLINPISPTDPLQNKRRSDQDSKTSSRTVKGESSSKRVLIPKTSVQSSQPTSSRKRSPSPLDPELLPSTKKTADCKAVESEKSLDETLEKINRYRDELRFLRKHKKRLLRLVVAQLKECRALRYMLSEAVAELKKDPDTADVRSILGPRIPCTQISDYLKMETDVEESSGEE